MEIRGRWADVIASLEAAMETPIAGRNLRTGASLPTASSQIRRSEPRFRQRQVIEVSCSNCAVVMLRKVKRATNFCDDCGLERARARARASATSRKQSQD